jgi:hypothetical protein
LLLHTPTQELFSFIERSAQSTFLGELINQALFLFQSLGCIEPDDISQLLTFADAQILSVRPQKETLFDFCKWILHLRSKFDF